LSFTVSQGTCDAGSQDAELGLTTASQHHALTVLFGAFVNQPSSTPFAMTGYLIPMNSSLHMN
jgi:hypothetical protein